MKKNQSAFLSMFLCSISFNVLFSSQAVADDIFIYAGQSLPSADAYWTFEAKMGDIDGDGDLDAVIANLASNNHAYLNDGNGNFTEMPQTLGQYGYSLALGDLDGDTDLDVVMGAENLPTRVWLNDGAGNFSEHTQLGSGDISDIELADIDGDGDLDVVTAWLYGSNYIWFNDGNANFSFLNTRVRFYSFAIEMGDVDGDGDLDAALASPSGQSYNHIYLNDGLGNFSDSGQILGTGGWAIDLGDVDNDGDLDAVIGGYYSTANSVWLNDGNGQFSDSGQILGESAWAAEELRLGDVDADGDLDFVIANYYRPLVGNEYQHIGYNQLWLNNGSGQFSDSGLNLGFSGLSAEFGDVDGDSDPDVLFGSIHRYITQNSLWTNTTAHDTEPPELSIPADITVDATDTLTFVDIGQATATDLVSAVVMISNDSPGAFPIGTTVVTWIATDDAGNSANAAQSITVLGPSEIIEDLSVEIAALNLPAGTQSQFDAKLDSASAALNDANPGNDQAGINTLQALINSISAQSGKKIPTEDADELIARIQMLIQLYL